MLRIMTLNLNYYADKHGDWPTRRELIVDRIQDTTPDAIAFQAVRRDPALYDGADQIEQLARYLPEYRHAVFEAAVTYDDGSQNGSGFLSRIGLRHMPSTSLSFRLAGQEPAVLLHARLVCREPFHLFNAFSWVKEQAMDNVTGSRGDSIEEMGLLVGDLNQSPDSNDAEAPRGVGRCVGQAQPTVTASPLKRAPYTD
jgi:endonuclease/exonuclease/phosphatase family metal-dependent hydrolase